MNFGIGEESKQCLLLIGSLKTSIGVGFVTIAPDILLCTGFIHANPGEIVKGDEKIRSVNRQA